MLEIMLGIYGAIVWLVMFKFKWIKPTSMSIAWASIVGVFIISALLYAMWLLAPGSSNAVIVSPTTPIVPRVKGYVTEVPVIPNQPLKKGDVLLKINPKPFQERVNELKAQQQKIITRIKRLEKLMVKDYAAQGQLDELKLDQIDLKAQLDNAQYDLDSTIVRAPADGYATFVVIRPGQYNPAMPLSPLMVFVHAEKHLFASFKQVLFEYINPGQTAEYIFDAYPGFVFEGEVESIMPIIAEGQIMAAGRVISSRDLRQPGQFLVRLKMQEGFDELQLPVGSHAHVATYSDTFPPFEALRRMLIRIMSWKNYLPIKMY
jgi:multidrug resistance efflux pump